MNLGYSNALWAKFFARFLYCVRLSRFLQEVRDRFRDRRTQVLDLLNKNSNTGASGITLSGVKFGENTTADGKLYVRITGAGPYTVSLYKATGGGGSDLMAQGSGAAAATVTLAAQNSSGLTGTYHLAGSVTAETDDAHYLFPVVDWRADADATFDRTDAQGEDLKSLEAINGTMNAVETLMDQAVGEAVALLTRIMVSDPASLNDRAYGSKFLKEAFTGLIQEQALTDPVSGAVQRLRSGALESLRLAMADEATGSTQTVVRRLVAAAAGVAVTGNDGQGAIASHTPEGQCPVGTYTLTCVRGLGNGGGGVEEFEVSFASTEDDRTKVHSGRARVGQAYKGEDGFGGASGLTITRTLSKTGDGSNLHLSTLTSWVVSGERESNTSSGVLHWKVVEESTGIFALEFYKAASMQAGDLVARSTGVAASTAFSAVERRGSGLTISGTTGSAPVNGTTGTLDLNYFTTQNTTGRPDAFTVAVTLTSSGVISRVLASLPLLGQNGYRLNAVASGSELITDGLAKANTFPDFSVADN